MNTQHRDQADNRVRPGFVILLLAMIAVIAAALWLFLRGTPAAETPGPAVASHVTPLCVAKAGHRAHRAQAGTSITPEQADAPDATPVPVTEMGRQWGVEFNRVTVSSNGVVDVSYTIASTEKAAAIADGVSAFLLEPVSGTKIPLANPVPEGAAVPAHSRARSAALSMWHAGGSFPPPPSRAVIGRVYSILLPNIAGAIQPGGKVMVVVGTLQTEITVSTPPNL